ncbi:MAG: hypothetical protein AseanaTS_16550 [Candidatus Pelagadaptatus aseana]|uniref:fused DSP-PTPase phosphatase/NAD kinase-like protein n=1 Tax=Candidatus Pelagadaptatus aseana TaxID=3120508 RepID=UPI0039B20E07
MSRFKLSLLTLLTSLLFIANTMAVDFTQNDVGALGVQNLKVVNGSTLASGQPTAEQLEALAKAGVKHVVNLRPRSEMDWDEAALVEKLGMAYHSIPVAGKPGITSDNARILDDVLAELSGQPVLVHCSSGNRVGSLIAVGAHEIHDASVDEALAKGSDWGLTRLTSFVRGKLEGQ